MGPHKRFSHISLLSRQFFDRYFFVIVTLMDTLIFDADYHKLACGWGGKIVLPLKSHRSKNFNFYFSNVNVFIISNYEPNFIEKLLRESGFSNFRRNRNDAN